MLGQKKHSIRAQVGDTIVEVLVAMGVASLVLATSYAIVRKNTATNQGAQERSQAMQLVQGQAELLHAQGLLDTTPGTGNQCFDSTTGNPVPIASPALCEITPNGSGTSPDYILTITATTPGGNTYKISATWPSILRNTTNNVTMYYRP